MPGRIRKWRKPSSLKTYRNTALYELSPVIFINCCKLWKIEIVYNLVKLLAKPLGSVIEDCGIVIRDPFYSYKFGGFQVRFGMIDSNSEKN